ncbi:MAG TPA: YecA family protein [Burkholderiales bacterium]
MNGSSVSPPDYDDLAAALRAASVPLSAAEVHGVLTGAASVPEGRAPGAVIFGDTPPPPTAETERLLRVIAALQEDIRARLEGPDFQFQPMLPSGVPVSEHVEALAAWARGYVLGLAAAGVRDPDRLKGEIAEFLLDAERIGEAEMDHDQTTEAQEREIAEIVEYLRAGVQLVYDELHHGR